MSLFYLPNISENGRFDEDESKHIVRVLRMEEGEHLQLTDGMGNMMQAIITEAHSKRCAFRVTEKRYSPPRPFYIHLAIAPTKNLDRIEWLIEKATEMGIEEISFLQTEHSERKQVNMERLEKVAISAMKQSLKSYLPKLNDIQPLSLFLPKATTQQKWIAHLEEGERFSLKKAAEAGKSYCILIGPEGDFSPSEIAQAKNVGFAPVTLGESRLRTETAGLAACFTLNFINE